MRDYNYGEYLFNLRKSIHLSQKQLADILGISNKAISKWETGESKPALAQLLKLSGLYNIPLEELLDAINTKEKQVYKIVITGGPCAGKSTALSWIQEEYTKLGYCVLFIPETATEVITAGLNKQNIPSDFEFQKIILTAQLNKEKLFESSIKNIESSDKILLVCDRGALDGKAYLDELNFNRLLRTLGKSEIELRDNYDAVFHLVTSAKGAEEFYTLDNNSARSENITEAILADDKTLSAWAGHPHLRVINNENDFSDKMKKLISEISGFLGEPQPYEIERKFLIKYPNISSIKNPTLKCVEIIQTYLHSQNENEEIRIRQRGADGNYTYTKTIKKAISPIKRVEIEKRISKDEYLDLLMNSDTNKKQIRKTRYCMIHNDHYFEIDIYPFWNDKAIMEVELLSEDEIVSFPDEIEIIKEVTNDNSYKNYNLAILNN
ncbi:MAG: AAA family ATPase [Clostridia bacterium]|nr:AAA family ATPase [Clostridia bacterium]